MILTHQDEDAYKQIKDKWYVWVGAGRHPNVLAHKCGNGKDEERWWTATRRCAKCRTRTPKEVQFIATLYNIDKILL